MSIKRFFSLLGMSYKMAVKSLGSRKLRSILTILGIIIGPAVIVMMGAVVGGYSQYILNQVTSLGQNNIMITPSSDYTLTSSDLSYFKSFSYVVNAVPYYLTQATVTVGNSQEQIYIYCTDVNFVLHAIGGLEIEEGSAPSQGDVLDALIGHKVAYDQNGNLEYGVGDVVPLKVFTKITNGIPQYKTVNVIVSGVLKEYGGALIFSPDQTIFLDTDAGQKLLGLNSWSGILVQVSDPIYVKDFVSTVESTYGNKVSVISFSAIADIVSSITGAVNYINYVASLSAFAVAIAGTTATMVTSVIERTKEIGVMKSIGYTNREIIIMILSESTLMSFIAAVAGSLLGVAGSFVLGGSGMTIRAGTNTVVINSHPLFSAHLFITSIGLTILVGVVGGILPAYMASRIPPAVALRYE
ncbi:MULTISPECIES: ABC transporter permease [Fervidicoccus]|uniref:Putative ABC transporter n=1 Tax=Fervidicoccus fontis (strain DSM 19380 / JCM 18336 / VKM B-2539 / Kam940) TaxID=1163730 RepID=H9ZZH9_FERFK|nr:ABC transporter permease [Fervidicoccus fontis]AFH42136.1 putative ABC transporter [Fervidicoccus fontis Kam940]